MGFEGVWIFSLLMLLSLVPLPASSTVTQRQHNTSINHEDNLSLCYVVRLLLLPVHVPTMGLTALSISTPAARVRCPP
jgi:hypothetical protein